MIKKILIVTALTLAITACSTFFDKDNTPPPTPLVTFKPEIRIQKLWYTSTGEGAGNDYLKLAPSISGNRIFTASKNGVVAANDELTGKSLWKAYVGTPISGGSAAFANVVLVGTHSGQVAALQQTDGQVIWQTQTPSEILAPPAGTANTTVVKSIDGHVTGMSTATGQIEWSYEETEPNLILRGSSAPQITRGAAIIGFANGNLVKLGLDRGRPYWQQTIAEPEGMFAIQRMVDIDADPIIVSGRVYAATYQGRIASLDLASGRTFWTRDISSYSGIASDGAQVFVSDADSNIWAFNAHTGNIEWKQDDLYARAITGPVIMGNYLVVGDSEGYLHWLSKLDGHFVARTRVNKSGILATPVVDNNTLYVYTKNGHLAAYSVQ